jgi:hypothetical protein
VEEVVSRNLALATTVPDAERISGTYKRPTSSTLEAKASLVRDLAAQIARGELSPRLVAERLEMLARGLDEDAGSVLALEVARG